MNRRFRPRILTLPLGSLLLCALLSVTHAQPATRPVNVAPQVWEATASDGETEFLVVLATQADLGTAATRPTLEARRRYVYDTLRQVALRSQAQLRAELDLAGVPYRAFYVVNVLAIRGDRALVARLAARPEVARIAANPHVRQPLPVSSPDALHPSTPRGIEWGVAHVNADDVWAQGYTGQGVVVAGQDTGYDWDHPALVEQYRGTDGITTTHDYNWHDAIHSGGGVCGADSPIPCDDHSHGTHTMGTIVGDDGVGNQIGVAPGARWIGCRNMDRGVGSPATYAECFEFFLAPYPVGGDPFTEGVPSLAPHVINNSWTCPPSEGCDWDTLQTVVENVRAAGIVVVASAGNDGPGCSTVQDPPPIYDAAFSVGATNSSGNVASFSSRGPVTVDGSGRPKPNVSAPGVWVRSSIPGGGYNVSSGTSMAGPHVAGVAALLWSAAPHLVGDVDMTEQIIARTARPRTTTQSCGGDDPGDVPNNVFGWGIVDALAAVEEFRAGLELTKRADLPMEGLSRRLVYTLSVTNTSGLTLTDIVLTDTLPLSTTFILASGNYTRSGDTITWMAANLAPHGELTATLAVATDLLPAGSRVVNESYGVRADELVSPTMGIPVETLIPWHFTLFPIYKNWSAGEGDGG